MTIETMDSHAQVSEYPTEVTSDIATLRAAFATVRRILRKYGCDAAVNTVSETQITITTIILQSDLADNLIRRHQRSTHHD